MESKGYIYYKHILSIPASLLYEEWGVMSYHTYLSRCHRKQLIRSREGKGLGNEALLSYHDLPQNLKNICIEKLGHPQQASFPNPLERYILPDVKASEFFSQHVKPNGEGFKMKEQIIKATSCMILNAITFFLKENQTSRQNKKTMWESITQAVKDLDKSRWQFKLPENQRALERRYKEYLQDGYATFIHKGEGNLNVAKVKDEQQQAFIEEILAHHNNLDDEQATFWYNEIAKAKGWTPISSSTMRNWRNKTSLFTYTYRKGIREYSNQKKMLIKRSAPKSAMLYWTMDGWVAELLYRQGSTYHHRLTAVIVLDPATQYIVGYAIGTHEKPPLIKEALRNALNHTRELFGRRYKPYQIQTDNYGKGCLVDIYQAASQVYTPAQVGNAKAKVIEPFFGRFNKEYFQKGLAPNWSGYGIKSNNQPNMEWLNKNKHLIPDAQGCRVQLIKAFEADRVKKRDEYIASFQQLPEDQRLPLSTEDFLKFFGEDTGFTNRLTAMGITPTILGESLYYDSFDIAFRKQSNENWLLKYDPEDLSQVLAINAKSRNGKLEEVIGTKQFLLDQKHEQPMALYEQTPIDRERLGKVQQFNKELEAQILQRGQARREYVSQGLLSIEAHNVALETLTKTLITDGRGQHKNHLSEEREQLPLPLEVLAKKTVKKQPQPQPAHDYTEYEIVNDILDNY